MPAILLLLILLLLLLLFEKKVIKDSWQSRNIMQNHVLIEKKLLQKYTCFKFKYNLG